MSKIYKSIALMFPLFMGVLAWRNAVEYRCVPGGGTLRPLEFAQAETKTLEFIREKFKDPLVKSKLAHRWGQWESDQDYYRLKTSWPDASGELNASAQKDCLKRGDKLEMELPHSFSKPVVINNKYWKIFMKPSDPYKKEIRAHTEPGALVYKEAYHQTDVLYLNGDQGLEMMLLIKQKDDQGKETVEYELELSGEGMVHEF